AHGSEQVAQPLSTETLESLGHQRTAAAGPCPNILRANLVFARGVAKDDGRFVLAHDNAGERLVILRLNVYGDEIRFDDTIGVKDVDEQFRGAMSAHAGQVGTGFLAVA